MKYRFLVGLACLLVAAGIIWVVGHSKPLPVMTVKGYIGGSKASLMNDPEVKKILLDSYHLQVSFTTLGGREELSPGMDLSDFIWPATELPIEQYKRDHGGTANYDSVLLSPIVMYSWEPVADGLSKAGFIEKRTDGIYYADMGKFAPALVDHKLVPQQVQGSANYVVVSMSDPTKSNSGEIFAAMLAKSLQKATGMKFDEASAIVTTYVDELGYEEPKTADLFKHCLATGVGACPIFVGYESLLPDYAGEHNIECNALKTLKAIYPVPTMWATHPMIANTPGGAALLKAMHDTDIQRIAVERHGFRSILGTTAPNNCILSAASVDAMPLPSHAEMDILDKKLDHQ
jgi:hypothetical protein